MSQDNQTEFDMYTAIESIHVSINGSHHTIGMDDVHDTSSDAESVASSTSVDEPEELNIDEDEDNFQAEIDNMWLNAIAELDADVSTLSVSEIITKLHDKHNCKYDFNKLVFHFDETNESYACRKTNEIIGSIQPTDLLPYNIYHITASYRPISYIRQSDTIVAMIEFHSRNLYHIIFKALCETGKMPTESTSTSFKNEIDIIECYKTSLYNHINCLNIYIQQLLNL